MSQPFLTSAQTVNKEAQQQKEADLLTQRGQKQLDLGQAESAFETWQKATKIYQKLRYEDGITGSLINQNLALQALGLHHRACNTLLSALKLDANASFCITKPQQPTDKMEKLLTATINKQTLSPVKLLALHNLGEVLRRLGKLDESKKVLSEILSAAKSIPSIDTSGILLSLGSTSQDTYKQARNQYLEIEEPVFQKEFVNLIQKQAFDSLNIYQQLINSLNTPKEVQLQAQLHHLSLMLDFEQWLAVESKLGNKKLASFRTIITQQIQPAVYLLLKNHSTFSRLPASYSVYAKLNFSKSLNKIPAQQFHSLAIEYAESALQTAKSINNQRLQSESLGTLGKLKLEKSQAYFEEALGLAQSVHAWDLAYQWQQELGLLYKEQGKYKEALQAYSAAIENVTLVRNNLSSPNTDLQFSFHEKVEPLYRDYMRLLLTDSNPNLLEIIQTNERLQIAELENYLQCRKLNLVAFKEIKNLDTSPTIIHIIDLVDSVEVISQSPKQPLHHHSIESQLIRGHINNLVDTLQDKNLAYVGADVILGHSQALYNLLIAPIKYLPTSGTLVFTLDASLQSLPMGLFHDGKNYLIERYGITGTLGSRMQPPKLLKQKQLKAFIAGLSKISPSFYASNAPKGLKVLPGVEVEIANVKKGITSSKVLLNEDFVSPMLDKELSTDDFSIIHLTTHAQFSSVPDRTMIFAWDKPITVSEFNDLLKEKTQSSQEGIELLVLSACQTAKGNKRSALGMAGVAVQAGARSTIATLWQVDADSSALLMKEFYQRLKDGLTKVEALRLAQLQLISNPQYQHPSHWAAFLLIGGWL
ncbi:MAG: CHAT domain-containing protein [Nostoc sp. EfeVER01]|uniref:CHAT domain-containing protein n=1 Tax=Nostoc sp. EfeVER01 TaxID=3075406 RepID=UPI002AD38E73|nr:CHAT domain-containing protein [Nostoc sp. EfeVER01]MDZ7946568.1 CHAT domain-containing protein [Nostoc sp. EfeVER01]